MRIKWIDDNIAFKWYKHIYTKGFQWGLLLEKKMTVKRNNWRTLMVSHKKAHRKKIILKYYWG